MARSKSVFTDAQMRYLRSLPAVAAVSRTRIVYADEFKQACLERYLAGDSPVRMFREAGLDPKLVGYKRIEHCFARWKAKAEEEALTGSDNGYTGGSYVGGVTGEFTGNGGDGTVGTTTDRTTTTTTTPDRTASARITPDRSVNTPGAAGSADSAAAGMAADGTFDAVSNRRSASRRSARTLRTVHPSFVPQYQAVPPALTTLGGGDVCGLIIAQQARRIDELEHQIAILTSRRATTGTANSAVMTGPGEPTHPTNSTNQTDPVNPADPADPVDPADATGPAVPPPPYADVDATTVFPAVVRNPMITEPFDRPVTV